jgi:2-dehydropantoate 2-reductase
MKICVFGAGAIGGHVAARLVSASGADVSVIARGPTLAAIRSHGLILRSAGEEIVARPAVATDDPYTLPPQDLVIVALKAPSLPPLAEAIGHLVAADGCAVFLINGIPWWWRHGLPGPAAPLPLLDPQGALWARVRPERALGCVVFSPNEVIAPAVIAHAGNNRYPMGEPDGTLSPRVKAAAEIFAKAGLESEVSADIRRIVWRKLATNASSNPLCALTRLAFFQMGEDPEIRALSAGLMRETLEVAAALGWDLRAEMDVEKLTRRADAKERVRSSIMQDVRAGRPVEAEALLGQTQAFARESGVAVPTIDIVLPLLRGLNLSLRASA